MESLIFALNAVAPIVIMMVIGYVLKMIGFVSMDFIKMANKLVFRVLLPPMLFLNVYKIENLADVNFGYVAYAMVAVLVVFLSVFGIVILFTKNPKHRGALLQASFRSNFALIGIPLAESLFGAQGVAIAAVLSAVAIPVFNVLAVISLSIFTEDKKEKFKISKVLLGIIKNPLIIGVFSGLLVLGIRALFVEWGVSFRLTDLQPIYKVLNYLSNMATPLALLVLGAQFEFSAVRSLRREIIFGTVARTVAVPFAVLGCAILFFRESFGGAQFAALTALFATPVAVSSVPMAQEMDSDVTLAGQLVVWTTLTSVITVFVASFAMKQVGIF